MVRWFAASVVIVVALSPRWWVWEREGGKRMTFPPLPSPCNCVVESETSSGDLYIPRIRRLRRSPSFGLVVAVIFYSPLCLLGSDCLGPFSQPFENAQR